jgi:hypothetical protein
MKSFPLIENALSETQIEFACFVERHAGVGETLYEADSIPGLPGDTVRMTVTSSPITADVSESRHTVEFMSLDRDGHWETVGSISHTVKQIEALAGRWRFLQSVFEIRVPGLPDGRFRHAEVETVVQSRLDMLRAARLLPLRLPLAGLAQNFAHCL